MVEASPAIAPGVVCERSFDRGVSAGAGGISRATMTAPSHWPMVCRIRRGHGSAMRGSVEPILDMYTVSDRGHWFHPVGVP